MGERLVWKVRILILVPVLLSLLMAVGSATVVDENTLTRGDMKSENTTPEFLKLAYVNTGLANHSNEQYTRIIRGSFVLESDTLFFSRQNFDSKIRSILSNASGNNMDPDHLVLSSSYLADNSDDLSIMKYVQKFKGLNIHSSRIIVGIKDGKVVTLKSNYYPEKDIDTEPTISKEDIIEIIEKDIGFQLIKGGLKPRETFSFEESQANKSAFVKKIYTSENRTTVEDILLVIYPESTSTELKYHLAYKVELGLNISPPSKWVYIIDANNGEIFEKYNKVVFTTLSGHVTGRIYPEHPNQSLLVRNFWNETLYDFTDHLSNIFWSGKNDNLDNYIFTKNPISITNVSSATLEFKTKFLMENEHDFGYVVLSTDGRNYSNFEEYTGIKGDWSTIKIDLSSFIGQQIWIGFRYLTDNANSDSGWYIDDIAVLTNNGSIFKDFADNFTNWNEKGFSVIQQEVTSNQELGKTGGDGFYSLSGLQDSFTLSSGLAGEFVDVLNETGVDSNHYALITTPSTHDIDWGNDDTSYKKEQSNVFYHINLVHDFFTKGSPFNIYAMNYQTHAHVQYPGTCNAFSDGTNIYFLGSGGGCESASLFSDIIFHEYTHNVIDHVYTTHALPNRVESGALNEGLADYFAGSINGNPCIAEGFDGDCVRNLNNTYRFPEDVAGETHKDSRIISGSSWDIREMLGPDISDSLVINSMKLEPFNFSEYLDDIIVADDNNANLEDGTPHLFEICTAFFKNHGIFSSYCRMYYDIPLTVNLLKNPGFESESASWTEYSNGGYRIIRKNPMGTYSGNWLAYMGDYNNVDQYIFQDITIPSGIEKAYVQFWYWITSKETTEGYANDTMRIEIRRPDDDTLLKSFGTLSNLNKSYGYSISEQYDLSEFKNKTIRLKLNTTTDAFAPTAFLVDDMALKVVYDTIKVCKSGCAYSSIQAAINAANKGDTIQVQSGTYYENVNVNKQLTLRGIGMPIVDANGSGSTITLSADGIRLEGFTVTGNSGFPEAGIKVTSNNSILSGNNVSSNNWYGISLSYSSNNTIYNNYFSSTKNSYKFMSSSSNRWNTTKNSGTNIVGGPYIGGNFWANPNGTGFSQICSDNDKDGICDSSYTIDNNNTDYLPLAIVPQLHDILSYYRGLGSNPNILETTDLLKAADDWSRDIAPPEFTDPITTQHLLALADEWSNG